MNPRRILRLYEWYKAKTFCCAFFAVVMLTMVTAAAIVRFPPVDIIKWKHFPRYCPFVIVDSTHKGQWRGALMFLWFAPQQTIEQIPGANNRDTCDLRRRCANYDVTVMTTHSGYFTDVSSTAAHVLLATSHGLLLTVECACYSMDRTRPCPIPRNPVGFTKWPAFWWLFQFHFLVWKVLHIQCNLYPSV